MTYSRSLCQRFCLHRRTQTVCGCRISADSFGGEWSSLQKKCGSRTYYDSQLHGLCIVTRFSVNVVHPFRRRVDVVLIMTRRLCIVTRFSVNVVHPFRRHVDVVLIMTRRLCIVTRFSVNVVHPFRRHVAGVHIMICMYYDSFSVNVVHPFSRRVDVVLIMTRRLCIMTLFSLNVVRPLPPPPPTRLPPPPQSLISNHASVNVEQHGQVSVHLITGRMAA